MPRPGITPAESCIYFRHPAILCCPSCTPTATAEPSILRPGAVDDRPPDGASLTGSGLAPWEQTIFIDHYFAECVLLGGAHASRPA